MGNWYAGAVERGVHKGCERRGRESREGGREVGGGSGKGRGCSESAQYSLFLTTQHSIFIYLLKLPFWVRKREKRERERASERVRERMRERERMGDALSLLRSLRMLMCVWGQAKRWEDDGRIDHWWMSVWGILTSPTLSVAEFNMAPKPQGHVPDCCHFLPLRLTPSRQQLLESLHMFGSFFLGTLEKWMGNNRLIRFGFHEWIRCFATLRLIQYAITHTNASIKLLMCSSFVGFFQ